MPVNDDVHVVVDCEVDALLHQVIAFLAFLAVIDGGIHCETDEVAVPVF